MSSVGDERTCSLYQDLQRFRLRHFVTALANRERKDKAAGTYRNIGDGCQCLNLKVLIVMLFAFRFSKAVCKEHYIRSPPRVNLLPATALLFVLCVQSNSTICPLFVSVVNLKANNSHLSLQAFCWPGVVSRHCSGVTRAFLHDRHRTVHIWTCMSGLWYEPFPFTCFR